MSKLIRISSELKTFLDSQAVKKGETYEQILRRLIEKAWNTKISLEEDNKK